MNLRKRIIIILYILSFTASVFIFAAFMENVTSSVEYTYYADGVYYGSGVYLAENVAGSGRIFYMDTDGEVRKIFSSKQVEEERVEFIDVNAQGVYAVLSTMQTVDEDDSEMAVFYRIVQLDYTLNLIGQTDTFRLGNEVISGFSAENGGLYLTMLARDGSYALVYGISNSEIKAVGDPSDSKITVESIRKKNASDGRFFSQAEYAQGEMYVRTDADPSFARFRLDENVANAVSTMKLSPGQLFSLYSKYILTYAVILIIWFIVLYLLIRMFTNRNRMFYYIAIAETVLLIIAGVGVYTIVSRTSDARTAEHSRFAVISLTGLAKQAGLDDHVNYSDEGFYDSEEYMQIRDALTDFVNLDGNSQVFYDVLIVRMVDGVTVASASGRNLQYISAIFGSSMEKITAPLFRGGRFTYEDLVIDNQSFRAIAIADNDTVPDYAIIGIINDSTDTASVWADNKGALILFAIVFAVASLLVLAVWYLMNRDLLILESALSDTALGKELRERPLILGSDIKDMWDALSEINKRVEEIQYSKVRILEAYYRFAPKNIEKLLQKDSIIDVRNGDLISLSGTIVTLNAISKGNNDIHGYDRIIGNIGQYQKTHRCMLIGKSPDTSVIQLFFSDQEKDVTSFFTEIFATHNQGHDGINLSASVFFDNCTFGVTGSDEETTTHLDAERKRIVSTINRIVNKLNLNLVISEEIKQREDITGALRFIGYVGNGTRYGAIKLYEVLDAYPARLRAQKVALLDKFDEALNSFYEKDFYISRTLFSDILKEMPDDAVVKWYVFESDRYLNESVDDATFKNLHV
ncbi:MAG: hypothetical protein J6W58_09175 [Lachnospiraceae bacterium]|nr:hypothetical protein [Lachnospiraceae bacterium]